jgi:hypothetical protein
MHWEVEDVLEVEEVLAFRPFPYYSKWYRLPQETYSA